VNYTTLQTMLRTDSEIIIAGHSDAGAKKQEVVTQKHIQPIFCRKDLKARCSVQDTLLGACCVTLNTSQSS